MELYQKSLFEKRSFYIHEENLKCIVTDSNGETEIFINYEDITRVIRNHYVKNSWLYYITLSFGAFSIFGILYNIIFDSDIKYVGFWLFMTAVIGLFYQITKRRYSIIDLSDGKSLFFLKDKPSPKLLEDFIASLFSKRTEYLRDNYFYVNPDNPREKEIGRLKWLLNEKVITNSEFEVAKNEINNPQKE